MADFDCLGLQITNRAPESNANGGRQLVEVNRGQRTAVGTLNHPVCVFLVLCFGAVSVLSLWVFHDV